MKINLKYFLNIGYNLLIVSIALIGIFIFYVWYSIQPHELKDEKLKKHFSHVWLYLRTEAPSDVKKGFKFPGRDASYYFLLEKRDDLDNKLFEMIEHLKDVEKDDGKKRWTVNLPEYMRLEYNRFIDKNTWWKYSKDEIEKHFEICPTSWGGCVELSRSSFGEWLIIKYGL